MTYRPRLTPPIADIRRAVRESFEQLGPLSDAAEPALFLVGLSGGADSLALAAALAFEAPRAGTRAGAVIIDHRLQQGSAEVAERAAEQARALGLDPVLVVPVTVGAEGGMEAAARDARYRAFEQIITDTGALRLLLAHTLDDQAETVLLGLARGSGAASLQGMRQDTGRYLRPLLGITRTQTEQFCRDSGLDYWNDPHNSDEQFTRVRVRNRVLPVLEAELGPGIAEALARTAQQLQEDNAAFEQQIEEFIEDIVEHSEAGISVSVAALEANPAALGQRIVRYIMLHEFGVSLHRSHTLEVMKLVTAWKGQQGIDVPGVVVRREAGMLVFTARGAAPALVSSDPASLQLE